MKDLIYNTLVSLTNQAPEQQAQIRQNLYEQLNLPFEQQLALYAQALAPASSGMLDNEQAMTNAVDSAIKIFETPER